jgi:hypothetical protein
MNGDKAVSVHEALIQNGKRFHKNTINALNRRNVPSEFLEGFEKKAAVLHTGVDAANARTILLQHFDLDIIGKEYYTLKNSEIENLKLVYKISKYRVTVKEPLHSPMYYFVQYLNKAV